MTHVQKIKQLLDDGQWHCAKELENISWSKHKRIKDAEQKYNIEIERQLCSHSISGAYDYRIAGWQPPRVYRPMTPEELSQAKRGGILSYNVTQ